MPDELLRQLIFPAPELGLVEGIDPISGAYPLNATPDIENLRVLNGLLKPRLGATIYDPDGNSGTPSVNIGSGQVHWFYPFYRYTGERIRLAARNGTLYELEVGVDTAFAAVSGGTGMGTSPNYGTYHAATLKDAVYITDRTAASTLKKYTYDGANGLLEAVTTPTTPSAALLIRRRTWKTFEAWAGSVGAVPTNWTETDSGNFDATVEDTTDDSVPSFAYPGTFAAEPSLIKLRVDTTGSKNDRVYREDAAVTLESLQLCFWYQANQKHGRILTRLGVTGHGDMFSQAINAPTADDPYLFVVDTGGIAELKYREFKVRSSPNTTYNAYIGRLLLPGRLFGLYRWVYTHYGSAGESEPSAQVSGDAFEDFTQIAKTNLTTDTRALEKCAVLIPTTGGGTGTDYIRYYRNGGQPAYSVDERGQAVWLLVGQSLDLTTTLAGGGVLAGDTSLTLTAATAAGGSAMAAGDWLVLEPATGGKEEIVKIDSSYAGGTTIPLDASTPTLFAHSAGVTVKACFVDNVPDSALDFGTRLAFERDAPPSGSHWVFKLPNGRLCIARWDSRPLGVAYSNQPTPARTSDHQIFPDGVDPLTRQSVTQGFRFDLAGDSSGDAIMWAGMFNGLPTFLTSRSLFIVTAFSQTDWNPTAIVEVMKGVGCIAGETVAEVNGHLYWVADGPRVMRWDGRSAPSEVSYQRITTTLRDAPVIYWENWFARAWSDENGIYYSLWMTPSGATTNTRRLLYNVTADSWVRDVVYASSTALAWRTGHVLDGPGDTREMFVVQEGTSGNIWRWDTPATLLDNGEAIAVRFVTPDLHFDGDLVGRVEKLWLYGEDTADTFTVQIFLDGSEYGAVNASYASLGANVETAQRTAFRTLVGRYVHLLLTGSVSVRPGVRSLRLDWGVIRRGRLTL